MGSQNSKGCRTHKLGVRSIQSHLEAELCLLSSLLILDLLIIDLLSHH